MNLSLSLFIFFALFFFSDTTATTSLRVSHQVSSSPDLAVDVRVDGESVDLFNNIVYPEASSRYDLKDQDEYLLSVYVSGTDILLFNTTSEFAQGASSTFFIVENPESGLEGVVYLDQSGDPTQYFFNYRVVNLATSTSVVSVLVDDTPLEDLGFDQQSKSQTLGAAVHSFSLVNTTNQETLVSDLLTLTSGNDYTVVINFVGKTTDYQFILLVDQVYSYGSCQVRGINSVPDDDVATIQVAQGETVVFEDSLDYSEISAYQTIPTGLYTVTFLNSTKSILATKSLDCESSGRYSLVLAGDASLGEDYTAETVDDSTFAPLYSQSSIRVVHLSPSPSASPASIILQGENKGTVLFPDASDYFSTDDVEDVSVVLRANGLTFLNDTVDLELGTSFSLVVFGLVDEQNDNQYQISAKLVSDFQTQNVPTTTTTTTSTTGSTTGSQDDDDDSGLSGGQIAGIVIGVLVGVALFGGLVFFIVKRRNASGKDDVYAQFQQH